MYDVILIGGISYDAFGRPLGPYRLRTATQTAGYKLFPIDYAWAFEENSLLELLASLITSQTKVLAISASWFERRPNVNRWATNSFFHKFKEKYPNIIIVLGGTKINSEKILTDHTEWFISGFSDIAFIKLLNYLTGKDKNIKYWKSEKIKIINADIHYPVTNMDDLETEYKLEDGFASYQPLPLEVSRGCIFKCAFCTHPFLGKKNYEYIRSSKSLARELKRNYELFGTYRYTISDDTFNDSFEKLSILRKAIDIAGISNFQFVCYLRPEILVTNLNMIEDLVNLGLKGCHLGIESFNNETRKAIGKGMEINRVLDMVEILRANNVKIHSSYIIGLPYETIDEILKTYKFLIQNREKYFHSWRFNSLGLLKGLASDSYSMIEKDPKKYGYETYENNNSQFLGWKNNMGMTNLTANALADKLNTMSNMYQKFAGWNLAKAWFHGLNDEQIEKEIIQSNIYEIEKHNGNARALHNFNKIISFNK
jgi:radical SAM superfamily enzyme YgiQ (UPF0313 family)